MRMSLISAILAASLLTCPALAQDEPEETAPGELALEGMERLMRALNALIEMIPQYEMPTIDEDGNIIIRRKPDPESEPTPEEPGEPGEADDQTST